MTDAFEPREVRKPLKLLLIGHARHGKDTVAEVMRDSYGVSFESSSVFVGRHYVYPQMVKEGHPYSSFEECFEDRVNHRSAWFKLIRAQAGEGGTGVASALLKESDLYVGMRNRFEFQGCKSKGLFDAVIWVDGSQRKPLESHLSMELRPDDADYFLDNNGTEEELLENIQELMLKLNFEKV